MNTKDKIYFTLSLVLTAIFGFLCGKIQFQPVAEFSMVARDIVPEISLISLEKITGDELEIKISGPARILWAEDNLVENDGVYKIPLGQIPTEEDLEFRKFKYLGNTKTMNFYPADSYPARGTKVQYRRFFQTKEAALKAGFNASKLVKE